MIYLQTKWRLQLGQCLADNCTLMSPNTHVFTLFYRVFMPMFLENTLRMFASQRTKWDNPKSGAIAKQNCVKSAFICPCFDHADMNDMTVCINASIL